MNHLNVITDDLAIFNYSLNMGDIYYLLFIRPIIVYLRVYSHVLGYTNDH